MMTISFMTQKGGAGKSTLAFSLAVAAREAGENVAILDLDPQGSVSRWSAARGKSDVFVESVAPENLAAMLKLLRDDGVSLCILDTPGTDSGINLAAMDASDLCLVPARPNVFDLEVGETTRRAVAARGKRAAFVLNQCPPMQRSARVQDGMRALEATGELLSPMISTRVDFQDAARNGVGVTEINRIGAAADEIRKLWASILRHVHGEQAGAETAAAA